MLDAARMYFYLFGVLAIGGGSLGFLKARSMASLIAGGVSGFLLLLSAFWMGPMRTLGVGLALVLSVALAARFVPSYGKTRKLMPAGLMAALSVIGVVMALLAWSAP